MASSRETNTMAEGLRKILNEITNMKVEPDADLPFLVGLETNILGYLRNPTPQDQAAQQSPLNGAMGQVMGQPPMGAPPGMPPMGGGPPMPMGPGMAGMVGGPAMSAGPPMGIGSPDELSRMLQNQRAHSAIRHLSNIGL